MTTNFPPGWSAEIYEFPERVRTSVGGRREDNEPMSELDSPRVPDVTFGNAWYHEAAIQESLRPYKRTQH